MEVFFVFSGQGAQSVGMGRELYDKFPAAKAVFDRADELLGYSLSSVCFDGPAEKLTESIYCQVAIYTMSCAALEAFRSMAPDVKPSGCAGLSLGEYAALYAAGAFSFDTGLMLLDKRAHFMDECCRRTDGGMASVLGGDVEVIREVCGKHGIYVANYNSPGQIVISGDKNGLAAAVSELKERGMRKVVVLNVAGAFHSGLMAEAGEKLRGELDKAEICVPPVRVYHNFTASVASSADEIRANLASQVAGSVRWEECARALAAKTPAMIEFGPGNVLTGLMRRTLPDVKWFNVNDAASLEATLEGIKG